MKSTIISIFAVLFPVFMFAQIDTEPKNNTLAGADALAIGVTNSASINPADDNDFFKFTITQPGVIKITVSNVPANIDMDYEFFNTLGVSVGKESYNDGENFVAEGLLCTPGTYTFKLGDNEGNSAQYTVRVDLDITDIYECNNSLPTATLIPLATNIKASIYSANDNDFYKFNITQPGVVKITVSNVPANIDMDYEFFNELGISVGKESYNDGENFVAVGLLCNPGTYAFKLGDNEGNPAQYTVRVDLDITDIYECNNSLPTATFIPLATNINASIYSANDNDFYKFNITQPGVVKITVSNVPANIDMDYEFFNELGISVGKESYNNGENFAVVGLLCNPGTYAFKLTDDEGSSAQYTVRVDFDITDIYECNQNINSSKPISCNIPIFASINPTNDNDCYQIILTKPDILTINVSNVPSNLDLSVSLRGPAPNTNVIASQNGNTGSNVVFSSQNTLQPGTYHICITDSKASTNQYKLLITCPTVVSTDEMSLEKYVKLYPNPTHERLTIDIAGLFDSKYYHYELRTLLGDIILSDQIISAKHTIDVSKLSVGMYIITVINPEGRISRPFVKIL